MSLEATIQENTQAIRELIAALAKGVTPTPAQVAAVATEAQAEKPAPAKKTQAAATQESSTPTASDNSASSSPATPAAEPEPTYQDAAAAITKLSRTKGRDAAVALLAKFGAAKLPDVKPEQFAEIIKAAIAAMGA